MRFTFLSAIFAVTALVASVAVPAPAPAPAIDIPGPCLYVVWMTLVLGI